MRKVVISLLPVLVLISTSANASDSTAAAQLKADKAQCTSYGIKKGTKDFSACMIQVQQAREQQLQQIYLQQQTLQAQQQQQEESEEQRRLQNFSNTMKALGDYAQQQQANDNARAQILMNSVNTPVNTNCVRTINGMNCRSW